MDIKKIVQQTLKKYSDGYSNPFYIAENMGFQIIKSNLGETNGYFFPYKRNNIIGINNTLSELEQKRTCAHELGHAVLHKGINYSFLCKNAFFTASKYEKEADLFAIYLLLSRYEKDDIIQFSPEDISKITKYPLKYINHIFNM